MYSTDPWWNSMYETYMMMNEAGIPFFLESDLMVPLSRGGSQPPDLRGYWGSGAAIEVGRGKRFLPLHEYLVEPGRRGDPKHLLMEELIRPEHGFNLSKQELRDKLRILTPFEIAYARKALDGLPFTDKGEFRQRILDFSDDRADRLFNEEYGVYPNKVSKSEYGETFQVSKARELKAYGLDDIGSASDYAPTIKRNIISVRHPSAGILHFFEVPGDPGTLRGSEEPRPPEPSHWVPFDGLTRNEHGDVVIDDLRSNILLEMGLGEHIRDVQNALHSQSGETYEWLQYDDEPLVITDLKEFNLGQTDTKHTPVDPDIDRDKLIEKIQNMKELKPLIFAEEVRNNLPNPRAYRLLINDIGNLDPYEIPKLAEQMNYHYYISGGHPDLLTQQESLFEAIDNRNVRGESSPENAHPITGYNRPVNLEGEAVPYKAMTTREKATFREHFDDLYDRPKAWLQHTPEGRKELLDTSKAISDEFDWDTFERGVRSEKYLGSELIGYYNNQFTSDALKESHGGVFDRLSVPEVLDIFYDDLPEDDISSEEWADEGYEKFGDLLTDEALDVINAIYRDPDARLVFGLDNKEEGLKKKLKRDTENELLGTPWIPEPEQWKNLATAGGFGQIGGIYSDEAYKRRLPNGRLQVTSKDQNPSVGYNISLAPRDAWKDREEGGYGPEESDYQPIKQYRAITAYLDDDQIRRGSDPAHVAALDTFLDESVLDQMVVDGVLPQEYSSIDVETGDFNAERAEGLEEPPEHGSPKALRLVNIIANRLRTYEGMRGYDNENGLRPYKLGTDDPGAIKTRGGENVLRLLYKDLNANKKDMDRADAPDFVFVTPEAHEMMAEMKASGEPPPEPPEGPFPPIAGGMSDEDAREAEEEAERHRQAADWYRVKRDQAEDEQSKKANEEYSRYHRNQGDFLESGVYMEDLESDPDFQNYQEELRANSAAEILANAPLDVRATAYRSRIQGLQDRLEESTNMGEVYSIARDWMRAATVEYSDLLPIDRDGTSKFKKLRDSLSNIGVDWHEVNEEWVQHQNTIQEHQDNYNAIQEQIDFLAQKYPDIDAGDDASPAARSAYDVRHNLLMSQQALLATPVPEFGSQAHVNTLYDPDSDINAPDRIQAYADRETTPIGESDKLTSSIRGTKNSLTGALGAGYTTWKESRLYGMNAISSFLQSVMSTIGEGTGIGADRIRGLDMTKPLEQMRVGYEDSPLHSYVSGRRETVYERNRKTAGRQGAPYRPPQETTPEQAGALEQVQEEAGRRIVPNVRVETPQPPPTPPEPVNSEEGQV